MFTLFTFAAGFAVTMWGLNVLRLLDMPLMRFTVGISLAAFGASMSEDGWTAIMEFLKNLF